jgi:eukaryotic-like serine/threonine-protein kinase
MPPSSSDTARLDSLAERLAAEMRRRWQEGERPTADEYLAAHAALRECPQAAAELIYEEVCLRREAGQAGRTDEVLRRYPQWAAQLRALFDLDDALGGAPPDFPSVGDWLGDFHLVAELGRGLRGQVFLARQASLAGRLVVVKVTPHGGTEHHALARMQHTHVVPLYAAYDDPERRLRVLVLPYFGGASLAAVLDRLGPTLPARRAGQEFWQALAAVGAAGPAPGHATAGPPPRLARAGYADIVCWVGACLADALAFAHESGLLHLDVKPSNVLLTADGQPMLLDFHLARAPLAAGDAAPPWLGGTRGYLSPEQEAALDCVRFGRPVARAVDGRSDVYSLGVVLYEALAGRPAKEGTPLYRLNACVSRGLSDVIRRCLAARPEDRYPDAAALADDLRRHLAGLPLRGVRNRDLRERWRKWRRRRPYAAGVIGLAAVVLAAAVSMGVGMSQRVRQAAQALEEGEGELREGRNASARAAFQRGLAVLGDLPFRAAPAGELAAGLRRAERAEAAEELHRVADQLRGVYGGDAPAGGELAALERLGRRFWTDRREIQATLADLPAAAQALVRADLTELALLWSYLQVRLAGPGGARAARQEALQVLGAVEREFGPDVVVHEERAEHARELGLAEEANRLARLAAETPARSSRERYALGCRRLRGGDLDGARAELERAAELEPEAFWAHYYLGRCATRQGRHEDAVACFTTCAALRPRRAFCYLHRAAALAALGRLDKALRDADRALELDPKHQEAHSLRETLRKRLP